MGNMLLQLGKEAGITWERFLFLQDLQDFKEVTMCVFPR